MNYMSACFSVSQIAESADTRKPNKFPPKPVKKKLTAKEVSDLVHKRFPRIMADLAK